MSRLLVFVVCCLVLLSFGEDVPPSDAAQTDSAPSLGKVVELDEEDYRKVLCHSHVIIFRLLFTLTFSSSFTRKATMKSVINGLMSM